MKVLRLVLGAALSTVGSAVAVRAASYFPDAADSTEPHLAAAGSSFLIALACLPLLAGTAVLAAGLVGRQRWWAAAPVLLTLVSVVAFGVPALVEVCQRPGGSCG